MHPESFATQIMPAGELGAEGHRVGEIRVGSFVERFPVHPFEGSVEDVAKRWNDELRSLLNGASAVGLPTASSMTWVLYRVGDDVFVRQLLILPRVGPRLVPGGRVMEIPVRATVNEDGHRVSEWRTAVAAVAAFLAA